MGSTNADLAVVRVARLATMVFVVGALTATVARASPITDENAKRGDPGWRTGVSIAVAPEGDIDGYTSEVSASPGGDIHFHVNASSRYRIVIYRLGWYRGVGGRRVACLPSCTADSPPSSQPAPPSPDPSTGIVRAGWSVTDTFHVPAGATSGYYLAEFVLTAGAQAGHARWYPFIVRPPAGTPPRLLAVAPVNTWQAYNNWGGKSLYSFDSTNNSAANHVSFDRPLTSDNAPVFAWELQAVRYLERNGYDVGYITDVDVDRNPTVLLQRPRGVTPRHTAALILGHSEYWSKATRDGYGAVVAGGRNLGVIGGDVGQSQVRYEDGDRTLVEYRDASADPDPDPATKTTQFRLLNPPRPECELLGVQYQGGRPQSGDPPRGYTVQQGLASDPWFRGTGLSAGQYLPDTVGYEWAGVIPNCKVPPLTELFHYSGTTFGYATEADAVRYTASSGARVFSAGSLQFSWSLDGYHGPTAPVGGILRPAGETADPRLERFVQNLLDDLLGVSPPRYPRPPFAGVELPTKKASVRRGVARVEVRCPRTAIGKCKGTLHLRQRRSGRIILRIGYGKFSIAPGARDTVRVRLSRRARRALRQHTRLRGWAIAIAQDARGVERSTVKRILLA